MAPKWIELVTGSLELIGQILDPLDRPGSGHEVRRGRQAD